MKIHRKACIAVVRPTLVYGGIYTGIGKAQEKNWTWLKCECSDGCEELGSWIRSEVCDGSESARK